MEGQGSTVAHELKALELKLRDQVTAFDWYRAAHAACAPRERSRPIACFSGHYQARSDTSSPPCFVALTGPTCESTCGCDCKLTTTASSFVMLPRVGGSVYSLPCLACALPSAPRFGSYLALLLSRVSCSVGGWACRPSYRRAFFFTVILLRFDHLLALQACKWRGWPLCLLHWWVRRCRFAGTEATRRAC